MATPLPVLPCRIRGERSSPSSPVSTLSESSELGGPADSEPAVAAPGSTPRLDQPDERADDAVKQSAEVRRQRLHPAERFRRFEARQRLPR